MEYEPSLPARLGVAFAASYWLVEALLTALPGVGHGPLLVLGPVFGLAAAGRAAITSTQTLDEPLRHQALWHLFLWVVLFPGTALLSTWAGVAVMAILGIDALETRFWFGYVLVSTTALGVLLIIAGGAYRQVVGRDVPLP